MMWVLFALLSAFFAAVTSILAKIGIEGINSNLATAIRTVVVLIMAWGIVFVTGTQGQISDISRKSWIFLILSGLATGLSWLFYYKALQMGEASKVVPIDKFSVVISMVLAFIILKEKVTPQTVIGGLLITAGTSLSSSSAASDVYKRQCDDSIEACSLFTRKLLLGTPLPNGGFFCAIEKLQINYECITFQQES